MAESLQAAPSHLLIRVALDPTHLLRARERVRDYLSVYCAAEERVEQVVLAVDEACTNAMRHSGATDDLEIRMGFEGADLTVEVLDRGRGFDVAAYDPSRVPEPLARAGRGLYLIRSLMDELDLEAGDGLRVRMVKRGMRTPGPLGVRRDVVADDEDTWPALRRSVIDEMGEAFAALDWEYRFVYGNATALDMYGLAFDEAAGRTLWEVFPSADALPVGRAIRRAMELGVSSIEEFVSTSIGRWVECRIYPTRHGVNLLLRDIDARKRIEHLHDVERRRAELLAATTARLLSAEDPQRVVEDICRDVMHHLGCHVFFNYLADCEGDGLVLNAYAGIPADEARRIEQLPLGVAVCGCAAATAERIVVEDVQHGGDERAELVRGYGVQAYVAHPLLARGEVLGTLSFGTRDRTGFSEDELTLMRTVAAQVAIAIDRDRSEKELRRREADSAAQDERSRLARDLHDSVSQALFAASLKAEALSLEDGQVAPDAAETMEQVRRLNRGALAQMRTMLLELRGEPIEDVPLRQLFRNLAETAESRAVLTVALTVSGDAKLPGTVHVALYRIAQEALNNVVRHAQATSVSVRLELSDGGAALLVQDDGRGFEPAVFGPQHIGLRSMRERADEVGARLRIVSAPGEGTLVSLDWEEPSPRS